MSINKAGCGVTMDSTSVSTVRDILKDYDPNEPRDWHGRWTSGGAAAGVSGLIDCVPTLGVGCVAAIAGVMIAWAAAEAAV
jgi:hypothetical protein